MSLVKWDPFHEMEEMSSRLNRLIGRARTQTGEAITPSPDWTPLVDVMETDKSWQIKADLPDLRKEDVKVTVQDGALRIEGERKLEKEQKDAKFHLVERSYGSFVRSFTLPTNVDPTKITAQFERGSLSVVLPKVDKPAPKALEVKVG